MSESQEEFSGEPKEQPPDEPVVPHAEYSPLAQPWPPMPAGQSPDPQQPEPALFHNVFVPEPPRAPTRIPHIGHVLLLMPLLLAGLFCGYVLSSAILFFRFGHMPEAGDVRYELGTEGLLYLFTLVFCILAYPILWRRSFFAGIQWRGDVAFRYSGYLAGVAVLCFGLAMLNGILLPGPSDTPIDRMFHTPGAAWLLFFFGITFAPFFEEMAFRGFLLPAFCTAWDWSAERFAHTAPRPLDRHGHPNWSLPAMIGASMLVSIPFALMHGYQTGYSLGPFLLLICVSLILSAVRLVTRSLAASTVVHACYNFLLFSLMFFGTGGFRHLEKM